MGLFRRQFGSILVECNPAVSAATLSAGEVVLHRIETVGHARDLARFWLRSEARCAEAIVQALLWITDRLEGEA